MRASSILALSAATLALCSATAWADPPVKAPAKSSPAKSSTIVVDIPPIHGFSPPVHAFDIRPAPMKAPLPELRQPFTERIAAAVEKDPF